MRRAAWALAGAAVVAGWLLARPAAEAPLAWAVCGGRTLQAEVVATGELRLHRALLPDEGLTPATLQAAVELQLRHAFAPPENDPATRHLLVPDGPPRAVEVLSRTEVAYGRDVALDWPDAGMRVADAYVRRALARGRLAAEDPALAVRWRARVGVTRCDVGEGAPRRFELPAPVDPFLLYWYVDAARRVELAYGAWRARTFPCAADEYAEVPHPEYLWYYWQPGRCAEGELGLGSVTLEVAAQRPASGDFSAWRRGLAAALEGRPLRVTLIFGYLDHQVARPDAGELRRTILTGAAPGPAIADEWGAAQFVAFLRRLDPVMTRGETRVRADADAVTAEVAGTLRASGRPVELTAQLAEADFLAPPQHPPRHPALLLAGLRDADVLVYVGHSGLGSNFSAAQLERATSAEAVAAALDGSPARVLGFIGCFTYSYFGEDLARRLPRTGEEAMFVYTGNAVTETADSALHLLRTVDCLLASPDGRIGPGACDLPPPGSPAAPDFLIYDHAR